ncbi:MAG: hypothetical protein H7829_00235 [Magnetococcus sp. THC-1_WYH]
MPVFETLSRFFAKKQEPTTSVKVDEKKTDIRHLYIHVSSAGWQSILFDEQGIVGDEVKDNIIYEKEIDRKQGGASTPGARIEAVLRNAIQANKKQIDHVNKICLVLGDVGFEYSDSKPAELSAAASGTVVRRFGQVRLNGTDVSYGKGVFPRSKDNPSESKNTIYTFVDANFLRSLLATFDVHGLKVLDVVPKGYQVISRSFENPGQPYGALDLGGVTTTFYLANPHSGNLLVRTIPVGYLTMVYAVAEGSGISLDEAVALLKDRDHVQKINPYSSLADESVVRAMSEFSQALHPVMKRLLDELHRSLDYFTFQKVSGRPGTLEAFGETKRVNGFVEWIRRHCNLQVVQGPSNRELLETLALKTQVPKPCNLLSGSETPLLTVGRTEYVFSLERGYVSALDILKGKEAEAKLQNRRDGEKRGAKGGRSGVRQPKGGPSRRVRPGAKTGSSTNGSQGFSNHVWVKKVTAFFHNDGSVNAGIQGEDGKYFALFALSAMILVYRGWTMIDAERNLFKKKTEAFLKERTSWDEKIQKFSKTGVKGWSMGNSGDMAKILWTEKFVLIGDHLNDHIWLSDLYLEKGHGTKREEDPEKKGESSGTSLMIQGNVLPSTDGHIQRISEFLGNMLLDKEGFMSDFDNITFHGAELVPADNMVRFKLKALYNADKRIKAAQDLSEQDRVGKDAPQPGLADMNKNIKNREQIQEKALRGGR